MLKKLLILVLAISYISSYADSGCAPGDHKREDIKQAVKWYRDSAEQRALYNQAYAIGSLYVIKWVKQNHPKPKTWGVILDIDETTLDNSWYFYQCTALASKDNDFSHYVANQMKSTALPGVVRFTHLVHDLGGYVSMVSNRDGSFKDDSGSVLTTTASNLKQQNVYFDQVVLANLRDSVSQYDKNPRFNSINSGKYDAKEMVWSNTLPKYKVIAYFGDNIQDFPKFKQPRMDMLDHNDKAYSVFSNGYFILPNPLYGSWESSRYQ